MYSKYTLNITFLQNAYLDFFALCESLFTLAVFLLLYSWLNLSSSMEIVSRAVKSC